MILYFFNIFKYSHSRSEHSNWFDNYLAFLSIFNRFIILYFLILRRLFLNFVDDWLFSLINASNGHKLIIIKLNGIFVKILFLGRFLCNFYLFLLNFNFLFGVITIVDSQSWLFCFFTNNFRLLLYLLKQILWLLFLSTWIFYFHLFFFIFLFIILFLRFLLFYFVILLWYNYFELFYLDLFYLFFERLVFRIVLFLAIILNFFFFSSCFQRLLYG